jgi:thiol:disulfide interchange protein
MLFNFLLGVGTALAVLLPFVLVGAPFFLTGLFGGELSTAAWIVLGVLLFLAFVLALFIGMWANTLLHGIFVIAFRRFKYQSTAPFGKSSFSAPVQTTVEDKSVAAGTVIQPEEVESDSAAGNEPASKEPDEDSEAVA